MKSDRLLETLRDDLSIFTPVIYEAPHRTVEEVHRLGEPRHYWRVRLEPRICFDAVQGQWRVDGAKVDERVIRKIVLKALLAARHAFDGADVVLALDVLRAIDAPLYRMATDAECKAATTTSIAKARR